MAFGMLILDEPPMLPPKLHKSRPLAVDTGRHTQCRRSFVSNTMASHKKVCMVTQVASSNMELVAKSLKVPVSSKTQI